MPSWAATCTTTSSGTSVGVSQEGAEEAHGAQLHREAEPVVLPATNIDQLSVGGVQVEVAVQLSPGGITGVAAIAPLLLGGEELDDHQVLGAWVGNGFPGLMAR